MRARQHPAGAYLAVKAAFRRLVAAAGGQEAAALSTRIVSHQAIGRYGRPHESSFPPVDVIADLEGETGLAEVTRVLADLAGLIVFPKPPATGDAEWISDLGRLAKESGEAIGRLGEAFSQGGTITADEIRDLELLRETGEAMAALAAVEAHLKRVLDGD